MKQNQLEFIYGPRCRWKADNGGWEIGSLVYAPGTKDPLQLMPIGIGRVTIMRRWHQQDYVMVKQYEVNEQPHEETT